MKGKGTKFNEAVDSRRERAAYQNAKKRKSKKNINENKNAYASPCKRKNNNKTYKII